MHTCYPQACRRLHRRKSTMSSPIPKRSTQVSGNQCVKIHAAEILPYRCSYTTSLGCDLLLARSVVVGRALVLVAASFTVVARLVLTSLVNGAALSDAVIMAFPNHVGVCRQRQDALDGFPSLNISSFLHNRVASKTYRIFTFLPPSFLVQMLNTSSPLRTLTTAPQTSSPASAN